MIVIHLCGFPILGPGNISCVHKSIQPTKPTNDRQQSGKYFNFWAMAYMYPDNKVHGANMGPT